MHYQGGMRWVGDFDLVAFYDTISHELLPRTIYPRTTNSDLDWIARCFRTWSSDRAASGAGHGLPQGPLASDSLAECYLLLIDLTLQKHRGYIRYVDDVRLFGATEDEVRADLIELNATCLSAGSYRRRGSLPSSAPKACRMPSECYPLSRTLSMKLAPRKSRRKRPGGPFFSAIGGKPYRVTDKTRLRYVLYRCTASTPISSSWCYALLPHHPEHADAFFAYLGHFESRKPIERLCLAIVEPYPYVRGEAWVSSAPIWLSATGSSPHRPHALPDTRIAGIDGEHWPAAPAGRPELRATAGEPRQHHHFHLRQVGHDGPYDGPT